ncbi:MAG: methyltransferase type 11 [Alphaproteobacteria bacterium 32-64-14]|nr:MAG: methyltransferase type 11 [Alphaproteobacteria bacterium 32-64-14]
MELPSALRLAVDQALHGVSTAHLATATQALSQRYRNEVRDGRLHLSDTLAAQAYIAARMPATYAAIHAALAAASERLPGFAPTSLLDVGAGPGTVMWATKALWSSLQSATLLETSPAIRNIGQTLAAASGVEQIDWRDCNVRNGVDGSADLVTLAYVLDELEPGDRTKLVTSLWTATTSVLAIIEPGTTAGWRRILDARAQLTSAGAHIIAPCPHAQACPITEPDWCHFSQRVARSRLHRLAKGGEVPWEDEKFAYLIVSRTPVTPSPARVLTPPLTAKGRVELKLCQPDGTATHRLVTRKEGDSFKQARRSDWGDLF